MCNKYMKCLVKGSQILFYSTVGEKVKNDINACCFIVSRVWPMMFPAYAVNANVLTRIANGDDLKDESKITRAWYNDAVANGKL